MSPSVSDETSLDLMYFQKSDTTIFWMNFVSKQRRSIFFLKNCDLYVVYTLPFWQPNRSVLRMIESQNLCRFNVSSNFHPLESDIVLASAQKLITHHGNTF